MPSDILIIPNRNSTTTAPVMQFSGSQGNSIRLEVLTSGSVAFLGKSGSLFSISDNFSGSLMAVGDISGLPILEVFSDDKVVMGRYNSNTLIVTGSNVGIGKSNPNPAARLDVSGSVFISGSTSITGSFTTNGNSTITGSLNISSSGFNPSLQNTVSITGSVSVNSMVTATGLTLLQPGFTISRIISSPGDFVFYSGSVNNPVVEIDSNPVDFTTRISTGTTDKRMVLAAGPVGGATSTFILPTAADLAIPNNATASLNAALTITSGQQSTISGSLKIATGGGIGGTALITIGQGRTANGFAGMYLVGDTTYTNGGLVVYRQTGGSNAPSVIDHRGTGDFTIGTTESSNLIFRTTNLDRAVITNAGNVAIGKTTANAVLDVFGNTSFSGSMTVTGSVMSVISNTGLRVIRAANPDQILTLTGGDGGGIASVSAGYQLNLNSADATYPMTFQIGSAEKMRISSVGNVGIGTASPAYTLQVNGVIFASGSGFSTPASENGYRLKFYDNGGINNDTGVGLSGSAGAETMWFNSLNGFYFNYGTGGQKITFDPSGNVAINKTTGNATLDVNGNTIITGSLTVTGGITGATSDSANTLHPFLFITFL